LGLHPLSRPLDSERFALKLRAVLVGVAGKQDLEFFETQRRGVSREALENLGLVRFGLRRHEG
jgi:hypothetical protein